MRKSTTKKITPAVVQMLSQAESLEREASLLRKLADTQAQLAHAKMRLRGAFTRTKRTSTPPPFAS